MIAIALVMPSLAEGTRVRRDSLRAIRTSVLSTEQSKLAMAIMLLSKAEQSPSFAFGFHFARAAPVSRARLANLVTAMNVDTRIADGDADATTHTDVDAGYEFADDDSCRFFEAEQPSEDPLVTCWLLEDESNDDNLKYLCVRANCLEDELDPEDSF